MSGAFTGLPFPPDGPTTLQGTIPSYLYEEYNDDDDLQTFVAAYNVMAQWFVDWFNWVNLPYYPGLAGALLDWVAQGLYGLARPSLSYTQLVTSGGYNRAEYNSIGYDEGVSLPTALYLAVTDDIFQRMITWHVYKGDGFQFTTRWLKQRVHRFLNGDSGVLPVNDNTADVSVSMAGSAVTITLAASDVATDLQYAVQDGLLALPFQYAFSVVLI
jgi:hypothetical protein